MVIYSAYEPGLAGEMSLQCVQALAASISHKHPKVYHLRKRDSVLVRNAG